MIRPWVWLFALTVLIVSAIDALLLHLSFSYFTPGFHADYLDSTPLIAGFVAVAALADVAFVAVLWTLALGLARALRLGPVPGLALAVYVGLCVPLAYDGVRYVLDTLLGRLASLGVLYELSGSSPREMAEQAIGQLPAVAWVAAILVLGSVAVVWVALLWARRRGAAAERSAAPTLVSLLGLAVACSVPALLAFAASSEPLQRMHLGLDRKPSAHLIRRAVLNLSDFDRDGSGFLSRPGDPAPFDGSVHAFALDWPANGVDENRLAGDHPRDFAPGLPVPVPESGPRGDARPAVLLILLESFRADVVGETHGGREVTPFLSRLGREGARSDHAYVHSPLTAASRAQLFGGSLAPVPGQQTLLHDYGDLGYEIAYFSGQNESFHNSETLLGLDRVDFFYDARQDPDRRTARGASKGALQVSWKLLLERIGGFLDGRSDPARPLLLYVNFTDAHFPYHHDELDDILGVEPIAREDIRAENRDRIWGSYLNASANVDRGVERLVSLWRAHLGDGTGIVIITADHGEALFEDAYLGHAQAIDDVQTQVPLIVHGMGGRWPEPLGLADLRGLLARDLQTAAEPGARVLFEPDSARRVFQYLGAFQRPRLVALRSLDGSITYDFRAGRVVPDEEAELRELIRTWEALRLAQAER